MSDDLNKPSPKPENSPSAEGSAVPAWVFSVTLLLLFFGGVYFDEYSGWFDSQVYAPYQNAPELEAYQPVSGAAAILAQGKHTYDTICAACHGPDGAGKPGQAPPLAG